MSKSIVKNSIANVLYKSLNMFFPLITATYISRILLAEGVGKVAYAHNIVAYFIMLAALGIPTYGTREIAKLQGKNQNSLFTQLFTINAFSTLLFSVAYFTLINSLNIFQDELSLYYAVGLQLVINVFNVDWYYQGHEEYGYIAIRGFIVKVLSVAAMFIFVHDTDDYVIYALISALAVTGNYLFNVFHLRGRVRLDFHSLEIKKHIRPLLVLTTSVIAIELYTTMSTTLLGIFSTDTEVGYYANSVKMVKLLQSVISAIGAVLLPRLSVYYDENDISKFNNLVSSTLKTMMFFTLPATVGLICVSDLFMPVMFGSSFTDAANTMRVLAVTLPLLVINVLFGIQVLITTGEEKKYFITVCLGAASNILIGVFLIYQYASVGASYASLVSEGAVAISTCIFVRKKISMSIKKHYLFSTFTALVGMSVAVLAVRLIPVNMYLQLFISIAVGVVVYIGILIVFKNEVICTIINFIKKRMRKNKSIV